MAQAEELTTVIWHQRPSERPTSRRPKGLQVQGQNHPWEEGLNWGKQEGVGGDGPQRQLYKDLPRNPENTQE